MNNKNSTLMGKDSNARTVRILHNIGGLFVLKGLGIGVRLLLVPITLNYLEPVKFGLWMALSSIVEMMILLEFGLGNGLRNKLTQSLAEKNYEASKVYVSTTYALSAIIIIPFLSIFLVANEFINWADVWNASQLLEAELNILVFWLVIFYGLKLLSGIILSVTKANHLPVFGAAIELASDLCFLVVLLFLVKYTENSLLYLGASKFFVLALIPLLAGVILFSTLFKNQTPSWRNVRLNKVDDLLKLSWKFFLIQLSSVIIFATDNIIISRLFGPESVTPYAIVFQYFNLITVFFAIVSAPLWSAYTEAHAKEDHEWIARALKKMIFLWFAVILIVCLMILLAEILQVML